MTIPVRCKSGVVLDLGNPRPEHIIVDDISWGLANQGRFVGQMEDFYSIAQHTLLVTSLVEPHLRFPALNHDNTEAYMGDVSRYLKHSDFLKGYRILESELAEVINIALDIPPLDDVDQRLLHAADDLAAVLEHVTLRQRERFNRDIHLPWAVESGFVTRSPLESMARLLPRVRFDALWPVLPRVAQRRWMAEFNLLRG